MKVDMAEEQGVTDDEITVLSKSRLLTEGVTEDLSALVVEDYTDAEIQADIDAVDFDAAYEEVNQVQERKRQAQFELLQQQEREKMQEEMKKLQVEEERKKQEMEEAFQKRQKEIEEQQ